MLACGTAHNKLFSEPADAVPIDQRLGASRCGRIDRPFDALVDHLVQLHKNRIRGPQCQPCDHFIDHQHQADHDDQRGEHQRYPPGNDTADFAIDVPPHADQAAHEGEQQHANPECNQRDAESDSRLRPAPFPSTRGSNSARWCRATGISPRRRQPPQSWPIFQRVAFDRVVRESPNTTTATPETRPSHIQRSARTPRGCPAPGRFAAKATESATGRRKALQTQGPRTKTTPNIAPTSFVPLKGGLTFRSLWPLVDSLEYVSEGSCSARPIT